MVTKGLLDGALLVVEEEGEKMRERAFAIVVLPEEVGPARAMRKGRGGMVDIDVAE